jgi:hypothetical protein
MALKDLRNQESEKAKPMKFSDRGGLLPISYPKRLEIVDV